MKSIGLLDCAVIVAFFAVMIGVGLFYSRRQESSGQYFGSDKSTPWWLAGVSIYMNSFSALAFVMYSTLAYKYGLIAATMCWASVPAMLLGLWFVALKLRRSAQTSPLDFVRDRFGGKMNQTLVWLGIPMQLLDGAFKLLAIGTVVGMVMKTALPPEYSLDTVLFLAIVVSGVVIISYTFLGGLKAAVVCDFIQFFVILVVVAVLPFFCLGKLAAVDGGSGLAHGMQVFLDKIPKGFFSLARPDVGGDSGLWFDGYGWIYMFFTFVLVGLNLATQWALIQRYASTRSEADAKKTGYLVAGLQTISPAIFYFPAMAARIFMPELDLNNADQMNGVYAIVCLAVLPTGMIGMMISAMFSATMSSLAGVYNAISNVFTADVYKNIINKNASDRSMVLVGRLATVALGVIVMALTFYMRANQGKSDLVDMCNRMFSVFLPPISVSMLIGLFARRASRRAGLSALVTGISVGAAVFVFAMAAERYAWLTEMAPMTTITLCATVLGAVAGTVLFKDTAEEKARTADFYRRLDTPAVG